MIFVRVSHVWCVVEGHAFAVYQFEPYESRLILFSVGVFFRFSVVAAFCNSDIFVIWSPRFFADSALGNLAVFFTCGPFFMLPLYTTRMLLIHAGIYFNLVPFFILTVIDESRWLPMRAVGVVRAVRRGHTGLLGGGVRRRGEHGKGGGTLRPWNEHSPSLHVCGCRQAEPVQQACLFSAYFK